HHRQRYERLLLAADFPGRGAGTDLRAAHQPRARRPADEQDPERDRPVQPDAAARRQRGHRDLGDAGAAVHGDSSGGPDRQRDAVQSSDARAAGRHYGAARRDRYARPAGPVEGPDDRERPGDSPGDDAVVRAAVPAVRSLLRAVAAAAPADAQEQGDAGRGGGGALTRSLHDATTPRCTMGEREDM